MPREAGSFRQALVRRCVVFSSFGRTSHLDGSGKRGLHVSASSSRWSARRCGLYRAGFGGAGRGEPLSVFIVAEVAC